MQSSICHMLVGGRFSPFNSTEVWETKNWPAGSTTKKNVVRGQHVSLNTFALSVGDKDTQSLSVLKSRASRESRQTLRVYCPSSKVQHPSPIRMHVLAHLLSKYNKVKDAHMRYYDFKDWFRIPSRIPPSSVPPKNQQSVLLQQELIREKIMGEVHAGRVAGPFSSPPCASLVCSPLGLVPKKEPGKFCLIHNLSYPTGSSVNDGLDQAL